MTRIRLAASLAVLTLAATATRAADPIGRLFFTPERRAVLERQRQSNIQETQTLEGATMSLDGVVVRSGGKSTVWINGRPQTESEATTGVQAAVVAGEPGRARLVAGEEEVTELRVGETINRATRELKDGIEGGHIQVHREPPTRSKAP